jgi:outer membrane lipoprotein LolB
VRLRLAAVAVLVLAGGCATLPQTPPPQDGWPARRAALQALDDWTLDGRIAVAAGESGFSGGFDWAQQGERADVALSGPLGGAGLEIHVEGDALTVNLRGETFSGDDARRLIEERIGPGHALPVGEMRFWLVGVPAPDLPHEETLGDDQRLSSLAQSGWNVRFERYDSVGSLALPARLEMTTEGLRLRVVVSRWRLPP